MSIGANNSFGGASGPMQVTITSPAPPVETILKEGHGLRNTQIVFPAGAYSIKVIKKDLAATLEINGEDQELETPFERTAWFNEATRNYELLPEFDVSPSGGDFYFEISYPSTSTVNPSTF